MQRIRKGEPLPKADPPMGFTMVYFSGGPHYGVGYSYKVNGGRHGNRYVPAEMWPASEDEGAIGITRVCLRNRSSMGYAKFDGIFYVPHTWLDQVFAKVDAEMAVIDEVLKNLGYERGDVKIKYASLARNFWGNEPESRASFSDDSRGGILERGWIRKVTHLSDMTPVGWYADYGLRPVMLLPK